MISKTKNKVRKYLLVTSIVVVSLIAVNYLLSYRLENYLQRELSRYVQKETDGFYRLTFAELSIHFWSGELKLEGIQLQPDSAVFDAWAMAGNLPGLFVQASVRSIEFKGTNLIWRRNYRQLHFKQFRIESPDVALFRTSDLEESDAELPAFAHKNLYEMISPYINELGIKAASLTNACFSYSVVGKANQAVAEKPMERIRHPHQQIQEMRVVLPELTLKEIMWNEQGFTLADGTLLINDFLMLRNPIQYAHEDKEVTATIRGLSIDNSGSRYVLEDIGLYAENFSLPLDNGFYTLHLDTFVLASHELCLKGIWLEAAYPKQDFAYKHPKHADWFDVRAAEVIFRDIDVQAWLNEQRLHVGEAFVKDALLRNYKNQQIIVPHLAQPMIYEGLQNVAVPFHVDTIHVESLTVEYEELGKKAIEPGRLTLADLKGQIVGLTNVATAPKQFFSVNAEGKLMGDGDFRAHWMIPVEKSHDQFLLKVHIKRMNLSAFNELIIPLAAVNIEKGYAHDVYFNIDANSKSAVIDMIMPYRDLYGEVLKEKNEELIRNGLITFFANSLIKTDNPDHPDSTDHPPREVRATVIRDPYHSTFNYLWQILRPALAETMGVSPSKQQAATSVMQVINDVKNFFKKADSADHALKKE